MPSLKKMDVTKEARISDPQNGILQPDLIMHNEGRVVVIDVSVCHENGELLDQGRRDKISKYTSLEKPPIERFKASSFKILSTIVGTRGTKPRKTVVDFDEEPTSNNFFNGPT